MQQTLSGEAFIATNNGSKYCFTGLWDNREAKFRTCFLPIVACTPAAIAALILSIQAAGLLVPWRPRWTRPFVEETAEPPIEDDISPKRRQNSLTLALTLVSLLGFVLQSLVAVRHWLALEALAPAIAWLAAVALLLIHRPETAPFSVLTIFTFDAIVEIIILADGGSTLHNGTVERQYGIGALISSLIGIGIILSMSLRELHLPAKEISQPSTEPTSSLRSPEDNLTLWQFITVSWMNPLIRVGYKRQLQDEDVWQLAYEFHHQRLHDTFRVLKGTVIRRLIRANAVDLCILTALGILELALLYASPVLLQRLLSSMEDITAPKRAAITYAALMMAARLIGAQSGVISLWYGRRCYERSRGEMITMLYEKTLGRKISFALEEKVGKDVSNGDANGHIPNGDSSSKPEPSWWQRASQSIANFFRRTKSAPQIREPASMGKILNLMRNDVYEVAQRFWECQALIQKPLSVIFSVTLVVRLLGWASMIAVLAMFLAQGLNFILARIMVRFEKKRRVATDSKLQVISQFVEAIRHLRWYGWQGAWLTSIMDARQKELNLRIITSLWNMSIGFVNTLALDLTPVIAFFAYTVVAGKPLRVDVAFPAMQLFQMMTSSLRDLPQLIIVIINAWVAVGRIEDFMAEPDKLEMNTEAVAGDSMAVEHASFAWPGSQNAVLKDINLSFPEGLTLISGEVASGKTALLQALLGELDMFEGQLIRPHEPIGYCAQTPWLQSMSIRENILFSAPYDEKRYKATLDACALTPDLAEFKAGDLSLIGENGIGLSGGQRARCALARAVYSRAKILLLDDPLSALDQQTAESIMQKLFAGPLIKGRIVVLVTHRTDLALSLADQAVKLDNGRASILDYDSAAEESLQPITSSKSKDDTEDKKTVERNAAAVPEKFIEDEFRAQGGVRASVYWEYIKAGKLRIWAILVVVLAVHRLVAIGEAWFLKTWGEAYTEQPSFYSFIDTEDVIRTKPTFLGDLPPPDNNIKPWLVGFLLVALGKSITLIIAQGIMIVIVYTAGKNMFRAIMEKVAGATFRFYDVTPVGRLMNRMTSDIGVIDGNISMQFQFVAWLSISWISSVTVIASVTPTFLAFAACLTIAFVAIFMRFIPTSQSLRRLEMVSLTPLMSNFGALLDGLTTVRAFGAQREFQNRVVRVVDTFQKMDHFYWSLQAWLMYRYDTLAAVSTFILTMLALMTNVSAGLTAFVLIAANKLVTSTHALCKQYGQLQMEFVSVERIVELLHLEQEPKGDVSPPAWWPSLSGDIVFNGVVIKYAPHLDPALAGISFTVKSGSKTAVIGRTGSGKSTLALAMLATIVPENGNIFVDNIDLAEVDKQLLRTRVTFLAQDPVLFPGSMRQNLDPVHEHSDEECEGVLQRVCERQGWELDTRVETGGRNLSQGQRQLVGLARAVLRRSTIIILDEATASIDRETALQIQQTMHEEMKNSTVITIAHRLEAVKNADYCIVLGKGQILKQGPAAEMLNEGRGDMVDESNEDV